MKVIVHWLILVGIGAVGIFMLIGLFSTIGAMVFKKPSSSERWRVIVGGATRREHDYYTEHYRTYKVEDEVSVKAQRNKEFHHIGVIKIDDPDFDDKLQALIGIAEERCATLNALSDEYN